MMIGKIALVPAAVALALYGYNFQAPSELAPQAVAQTADLAPLESDTGTDGGSGHDKNDDNDDGGAGHDKNDDDDDGGSGHDKNDDDDNGGSGHDKNDDNDDGGAGHDKNDDNDTPRAKPRQVRVIVSKAGSDGPARHRGGRRLQCRIDDRIYWVRTNHECRYYIAQFGSRQDVVVVKAHRKVRRAVVVDAGHSCGGAHAGSYSYVQPRVVRYFGTSRAAQMQLERRGLAASGGCGTSMSGHASGMMIGYGNGVMVGGVGNTVVVNGHVYAGNGVVAKTRKARKGKRRIVYDYHYEPEVTKSGGY